MATKRIRKHKSSGTQWTAEQHREAGHERLNLWVNGTLKTRIDALKAKHGSIADVLEAAITVLERDLYQ